MNFTPMRMFLHVLFWSLIWFWMTTVYLYNPADFLSFLLFNLQRLPVIMAATYAVNHWVVSGNLVATPPGYWRAAVYFFIVFVVATLLDRIISGFTWLEPTLEGEPLEYQFINPIAIFKNAFLLLSILGISASIEFFRITVKHQKQIFDLKEEKLKTELAFLRSQINPHFLFNAFNNLYSLAVREGSHDLAKGLSGMAGLMRYLTYDSQVPEVLLTKEVNLIQSFIEMQKLRAGDDEDIFINFRVEGNFTHEMIAPVILLPLVENAFKHGIVPRHPAWIDILLRKEDNALVLEVTNKKVKNAPSGEEGVGLKNLQKRLTLLYPKDHRFVIDDKPDTFKATLTIGN